MQRIQPAWSVGGYRISPEGDASVLQRNPHALLCRGDSGGTGFDLELAIDLFEVEFHGVLRNVQRPTDLLVRASFAENLEDLVLAKSEIMYRWSMTGQGYRQHALNEFGN